MNYALRPTTSPPSSHPGYRTRPAHQVFPEDIDCVIESTPSSGAIFIGNLEAAQNLQTLRRHKIASLLTACKNIHIRHPKEHVAYSLYVPGEDHENYDLSLHFQTAADFIHQSLQETNILVHCMAGISRSVTLVIAYLIKYRKMTYPQALRLIQSKRSKINPNPGFVRQLQQYEQTVLRTKKFYPQQEYENYAPMRESYFGKTRTNTYSANYSTFYASKDSQLKFKSKYDDYSKYLSSSNLQVSKARVANPQRQQPSESKSYANKYQMRASMQTLFYNPNKTVNQRRQQRNSTTLGQITNYPDYSTIRSSNIQDLSKDLDDRIAKIKQKYYQGREMQGSRNVNHSQQRRLSNDVVPLRNVKGRESFNSSGFNPFHAVRTMTYQYI